MYIVSAFTYSLHVLPLRLSFYCQGLNGVHEAQHLSVCNVHADHVCMTYVSALLPPAHQAAAALLQAPTEPVNDSTYFECLDVVADKSQVCVRECGLWQTFHAHLCGTANCTLLQCLLLTVPLYVAVHSATHYSSLATCRVASGSVVCV